MTTRGTMGWRALGCVVGVAATMLGACADSPHQAHGGDGGGADLGGSADQSPVFDCATCGEDQACIDNACSAPSATQSARVAALGEMVDQMASVTSYPYSYDREAIIRDGKRAILHGPDTDETYLTAMWRAFLAIPEGHQSMLLKSGCGKKLPYSQTSRFGVCVRPSEGGLVVTRVKAGTNQLGLSVGDEIVSADGLSRDAMLAASFLRPTCGSTYPSLSGQNEAAAVAFFATAPSGMSLAIKTTTGETRTVTVPATPDTTALDCGEVFGRTKQIVADATTLPDGTAVIRLPSFVPYDVPFPNTNDPVAIASYRDDFIARIKTAFDTVKDAPRLVWDVRGNGGGLTLAALAIGSGMPGAQSTTTTYCTARLAGTDPVAFDDFRYAEYALSPGGDFLYTGKVAVLIDGLDYSASDYFAHFVRHATSATLVGAATAGAYGGSSGSFDITSATPALTFYYDTNRCVSGADDLPLEGQGVEPHLTVRYDPIDLAEGRDTVLEAAIAALSN